MKKYLTENGWDRDVCMCRKVIYVRPRQFQVNDLVFVVINHIALQTQIEQKLQQQQQKKVQLKNQ